MVKIIYPALAVFFCFTFVGADPPCAYWCEATCAKKVTSFYCCSYQGSLQGPTNLQPPPCHDLCRNRPDNMPAQLRDCRSEMTADPPVICKNFKECDRNIYDGCCTDYCLPNGAKKCTRL